MSGGLVLQLLQRCGAVMGPKVLPPMAFLWKFSSPARKLLKWICLMLFKSLSCSQDILFSILQYADNCLAIGEASHDNSWALKVILRSFKMVSGLKIIPIGANPCRYETWKPIIKVFDSRLASWKGRNLSMGGHITLINSVPGILPLFFFSFFKALKEVLNIVNRNSAEISMEWPCSSQKRCLGIWYKNIPFQSVVWAANRANPINDSSGILTINTTAYGNCMITETQVCQCLIGFSPKSPQALASSDWSQGCVRNTQLSCNDVDKDGFVKFEGLKVPDTTYTWVDESIGLEECRVKCLTNCSCMTYTNSDIRGTVSGCVMWFGDLIDMRQFETGGQGLPINYSLRSL
ncbi:hypothetical protein JHK82_016538 [Glycine max]|nr:hypothetical protein JHK82_016538 [Glycine max]